MHFLPYLRTFLSLTMFGYAAWQDVKTREVHDLLWISFGGLGTILIIYELITGSLVIIDLALSLAFSILFTGMVLYLELLGEADLLALITLSILHPSYPELMNPVGVRGVIYPFSVLSNSVLIGASEAILLFIRNISKRRVWNFILKEESSIPLYKRLIVVFVGINTRMDSLVGPPFQYPLEVLDDKGKKSLILRPDFNDDEKAREILKQLNDEGYNYAWVSYTLPFLAVMLLGYLSTIFLGDIIFTLISMVI